MSGDRWCGLLLAGGAGTRLWPASTGERPKQFQPVLEQPLLLLAAKRLLRHVALDSLFIATTAERCAVVRECLPDLPERNLLVEPSAVGTLPAFALASARIERLMPNAMVLACPTDSYVSRDDEMFDDLVRLRSAAEASDIAVLGAVPAEPDSGMGYLEVQPNARLQGALTAIDFHEKPQADRARSLIQRGALWNTACYAYSAATMTRTLAEARPTVMSAVRGVVEQGTGQAFRALRPAGHELSPYFEQQSSVRVVPTSAGWRDVGTWGSLLAARSETVGATDRTEDPASVTVDVLDLSGDGRPVHAAGVADIVVILASDAIYLAHRDVLTSPSRLQDFRNIVEGR